MPGLPEPEVVLLCPELVEAWPVVPVAVEPLVLAVAVARVPPFEVPAVVPPPVDEEVDEDVDVAVAAALVVRCVPVVEEAPLVSLTPPVLPAPLVS